MKVIELKRVGTKAEKMRKLVSARVVVIILNSVIL